MAFARVCLGLSAEEFYALTPALFAEMAAELRSQRRREEAMLAALRCDVINYSFYRPKEILEPRELLPPERSAPAATGGAAPRMTRQRRRAVAEGCRAIFGALAEAL